MISPGRIVTIFRGKGGNGQSTKTFDALSEPQKALLLGAVREDKPLIVSFFSTDEWLAVTESRLVVKHRGHFNGVPLEELDSITRPANARLLGEGKRFDGRFELRLRDGSLVTFESEAGKPFVGLLNVFMYVIKMNHRH